MHVTIKLSESVPETSDAVGHFVFEGLEPASDGIEVDETACERRRFAGKVGESVVEGSRLRVLVGLGRREELDGRSIRRAVAAFTRATNGCSSAALVLPAAVTDSVGVARSIQAAIEGAAGASYRYSRYRTSDEPAGPAELTLVGAAGATDEADEGLRRGTAVAEAIALARDLGNTPAGDLTPERLADVARQVAAAEDLGIEVLGVPEMESAGLGGLLGVARGSAEPPRLVKLTYEPQPPPGGAADDPVPTVALVGKGITFDSGGLSLKTGDGMMNMKGDMSGAAAVIAALGACRALGVRCRVIGIAPITENMPGGRATKPGDVLKIRNGKTIEVLNTDAEGRLVLADGLSLAAEEAPDSIVDIATLTGACVVALGNQVAGVMGNDSRAVRAIEHAAAEAGEGFWHLPLPRAYRSDVESEVADMKNIGRPGSAGTLIAGLILEEFVGDRPWAHLDIAGVYRTDDDSYELRKGATGFGVRTLLQYLSDYEAIGAEADLAADGPVR